MYSGMTTLGNTAQKGLALVVLNYPVLFVVFLALF